MFKDITGQRFERLVVIERKENNKTHNAMWLCLCDCGKTTTVSGIHLRNGNVRSCGCLMIDTTIKQSTKHGQCKRSGHTKTYNIWCHMKSRCEKTGDKNYLLYGGRGITVCDSWHNFTCFFEDMGECPENMSLDRINVNGNYEPTNCRWATQKEQCNNKRNNHMLTYNGKTQNITQWAKDVNIKRDVIGNRIRRGWDIEKALTKQIKGNV